MKHRTLAGLYFASFLLALASCQTEKEGPPSEPTPVSSRPVCSLTANFLGYDDGEPLLALAFRNESDRPLLLYRWFESSRLSKGDAPPDSALELEYSSVENKPLAPVVVPDEYFALYDPAPPLPEGLTVLLPGATYRTALVVNEEFGLNSQWDDPLVIVVRFRSDAASWFKTVYWRTEIAVPTEEFCDDAVSEAIKVYRLGPRTDTVKLVRDLQASEGNKSYTARLEVSPDGVLESCRVLEAEAQQSESICQSVKRWKFAKHERGRQIILPFPRVDPALALARASKGRL